jgi:hypothetical protein
MYIGGILLIQVDLEEPVMGTASEVLVPIDENIS